jgi:LacI family transcriptional regulator
VGVGRAGRPTITTVAAHAGVSPMTVSRVLGGSARVSPDLAARVRESVAALGYRRNEQARALRPGQRSGLVGVAITNIANPYYADFVLGAEEVLEAAGRTVLLGSTGEAAEREERLVAGFIGRQVEGLIVVPTGVRAHLLPRRLDGLPLVLASRQVPGIGADAVLVADVQGSYEGTSALLADGHERIGFLGHGMSTFTGQRRLEGFRLAHEDAGRDVDERLVLRDQRDPASAEAAMKSLLAYDLGLTAVFCANNRNAIGAVRALVRRRRAGQPGEVTVLSFDDFELADAVGLPVLVVDHDGRELGREAARLLLDRLTGERAGPPRTVELPTRLRRVGDAGEHW